MIPIKIACDCGQRYAFDIEPLEGCMPSPVACPGCGADGTTAANAIIAESVRARPVIAVARATPLRIDLPVHSSTPAGLDLPSRPVERRILLPGQVDEMQALNEAKAKISWGDPPEKVTQYLMGQGFDHVQATGLVTGMFQERAVTIRRNGIVKIVTGSGLVCVPIIALIIFLSIKFLPLKIFAFTVMIGLWGAWRIFKGTFMVIAPKFEPGDVSEQ